MKKRQYYFYRYHLKSSPKCEGSVYAASKKEAKRKVVRWHMLAKSEQDVICKKVSEEEAMYYHDGRQRECMDV